MFDVGVTCVAHSLFFSLILIVTPKNVNELWPFRTFYRNEQSASGQAPEPGFGARAMRTEAIRLSMPYYV